MVIRQTINPQTDKQFANTSRLLLVKPNIKLNNEKIINREILICGDRRCYSTWENTEKF